MRGFHPGSLFCNTVAIRGVDGSDPDAVSRATQDGRRRCAQVDAAAVVATLQAQGVRGIGGHELAEHRPEATWYGS